LARLMKSKFVKSNWLMMMTLALSAAGRLLLLKDNRRGAYHPRDEDLGRMSAGVGDYSREVRL